MTDITTPEQKNIWKIEGDDFAKIKEFSEKITAARKVADDLKDQMWAEIYKIIPDVNADDRLTIDHDFVEADIYFIKRIADVDSVANALVKLIKAS